MQNDITNVVTMLQEAKRLNNDLGHHVRRASFSTHLSGRFYQNNSLESHKARSSRISRMKAERRKLEKFLELEEKKIKFLEERLYEKQMERRREEEKRMIQTLSSIKIQSKFRSFSAFNKLQLLRVERDITVYVVLWLQSIFRGNRDRCLVQRLKDKLARQLKEASSSICIQTKLRQCIAKKRHSEKRREYVIRRHNAACTIQALVRGYHDRRKFVRRRQELASIQIQRVYRGFCGRKLRDKRRKKKSKRIPLHERRYSSYGAAVTVDTSRRGSISSTNTPNGISVRTRRASLPGWDVLRKAVGTESAKFRTPLKPVVDRIPSRCTPMNLECSSVQSKATSSTKNSSKVKPTQKKRQSAETLKAHDKNNPKAKVMSREHSITLDSNNEATKIREPTKISTSEHLSGKDPHTFSKSINLEPEVGEGEGIVGGVGKEETSAEPLYHSTPFEKSFETVDSIKGNSNETENEHYASMKNPDLGESETEHSVLMEKPPGAIDCRDHNDMTVEAVRTEPRNHSATNEKSSVSTDSVQVNSITIEEDGKENHVSRKPLNIPQHAINIEEDRTKPRDPSAPIEKSSKSAETNRESGQKISSTNGNHVKKLRNSITKRALEISRKKKAEEEEQKQKRLARKVELQKLEEARRSKMKQENEEREARKAAKRLSKKKNDRTILPIVDAKSEGKTIKKHEICSPSIAEVDAAKNTETEKKNNILMISSHIVIDVSFLDGPFDEDCTETEFDLD